MPGIPMIKQTIGKGLDGTVRKVLARTLEYGRNNPDKFANAMIVTSIVSKDAVGCYYYVTQSLHNKKIPEEKRKFVAALDLMNGIIMVFGQIFIAKVIDKTLSKRLFDNIIAKKLDKDVIKNHLSKAVEEVKKTNPLATNVDIKELTSKLIAKYGSDSKFFKTFKGGFGLLLTLVATTALTKRVIAPFLSTPLAGWFKGKFMDKQNKNAPEEQKNNATENKDYYPIMFSQNHKSLNDLYSKVKKSK